MEKLAKVAKKDIHIGCATCSTVPETGVAPMDMLICVGFGSAYVTKDGVLVYDGEADMRNDVEPKTLRDIEAMAVNDSGDWRVVLHGPMHGETYQRQRKGKWVMVESNDGFA